MKWIQFVRYSESEHRNCRDVMTFSKIICQLYSRCVGENMYANIEVYLIEWRSATPTDFRQFWISLVSESGHAFIPYDNFQ